MVALAFPASPTNNQEHTIGGVTFRWNGTAWKRLEGDIDADTLDGQEGTYYLDYDNLSDTPTIPGNTEIDARITTQVDKDFVDGLGIDYDMLSDKPTILNQSQVDARVRAVADKTYVDGLGIDYDTLTDKPIVALTQSTYDNLATKDSTTLYLITDAS